MDLHPKCKDTCQVFAQYGTAGHRCQGECNMRRKMLQDEEDERAARRQRDTALANPK